MKLAQGNGVLMGYMLLTVGIRIWMGGLYKGVAGGYLAGWIELSVFAAGLLAGWVIPALDHLIYCYTYPHELTPMRVLELARAKRYKEAVVLLRSTVGERSRLVLHGIVFQAVFAMFSFWVVSSSGNEFGRGLVIGVLLNLLAWDYRALKSGRAPIIFWQIRRVVGEREAGVVVAGIGLMLTYLTLATF